MSLASVESTHGVNPTHITTRFGEQEIDPQSVIHFANGLPGFEELKAFKLFHEEGKTTLFYLQSLDDTAVQLPLVDPDHFQVNYEITLSDEELAQLQLENAEDATVLVTVSRAGDPQEGPLHANFMGPIIINTKARTGLQKALNHVSGTVVIKAE